MATLRQSQPSDSSRTFWRWLRAGLVLPLVVLLPALAITGQDTYAELIVLIGVVFLVLALLGARR